MPKLVTSFAGCVAANGTLVVTDVSALQHHLLSLVGEDVVVQVYKASEHRSLSQHRYYRGVVVRLLAEHCGYDDEQMHAALKEHFGLEATSTLSREEMSVFIDRVRAWANSDLGVMIPDPDSVSVRT